MCIHIKLGAGQDKEKLISQKRHCHPTNKLRVKRITANISLIGKFLHLDGLLIVTGCKIGQHLKLYKTHQKMHA